VIVKIKSISDSEVFTEHFDFGMPCLSARIDVPLAGA
jgi:hypothetical protein